jgi:hypothetical protein
MSKSMDASTSEVHFSELTLHPRFYTPTEATRCTHRSHLAHQNLNVAGQPHVQPGPTFVVARIRSSVYRFRYSDSLVTVDRWS